MTEVNIPLLRKAVEWVEEQDKLPEISREWNQRDYVEPAEARSRTLAYFAVAIDKGLVRSYTSVAIEDLAEFLLPHCGSAYCVAGYVGQLLDERYEQRDVVGGVHVSEFAQKELGITYDQAEDLFEGSNSARRIRQIAERIAGCPL